MEFYVIKICDSVSHDNFVVLRVPVGSLEDIVRWFINDNNHLELTIANRGFDNSFSKSEFQMEVIVYFSIEKPLFKRVVMCPDAFDIKSFVSNIKAIFGEKITIQVIIT